MVLTYDLLEERCIDDITIKHILLLYHTKQIDSILSWVCAVMDQRRHKDILRNNINKKVRNNYSKEPRIVTDMLNKLDEFPLDYRCFIALFIILLISTKIHILLLYLALQGVVTPKPS